MHVMTCLGWPEGAQLRNCAWKKLSWLRSCLRKGRDLLVRAPVLLTPWLLIFTTAAHCQTTMDPASFAGKQIKLLIGFSPTGYGYDTYGRLLARHLGKYLPGNPLIIPQNRPGAGSLNLANYLYNAAPKGRQRDRNRRAWHRHGTADRRHRLAGQVRTRRNSSGSAA